MADKPQPAEPDRRERHRVGLDIKILVQAGGRSEVGSIQNMTRTGVYFLGFGDYRPGMMVEVSFPYDPTKPDTQQPQRAEVVRVQEIEGSMKKGVAITMSHLFLKP